MKYLELPNKVCDVLNNNLLTKQKKLEKLQEYFEDTLCEIEDILDMEEDE